MKFARRIALAAMVAMPATLVAQSESSQSPESAQRFISLVARDHQLIAERAGDGVAMRARVVATESADVCSTRLIFGATSVRRGYFGFSFDPSPRRIDGAQTYYGIRITAINANSAAAKIGLAAGDLIVSLKGQPITAKSNIANMIARIPAGQVVDIELFRGGRLMKLQGAPGTRPDEVTNGPMWVGLVSTANETPIAAEPATIDWGRTSVSQGSSGSFVLLTSGTASTSLRLEPSNPGMETRLMYALRFLRESCDETAETGF